MIDLLKLDTASRILDVGIDPFIFTGLLAERADPSTDIEGVSYGDTAESTTTRTVAGRDVTVSYCNVEKDRWPYDRDSFDRIVLGAIIEHLFDPISMLREARRVLQPTGVIVLSTPNAVRLLQRVDTLIGINPYDGYALESRYNRHNHEWTREELVDILDVAGFEVVNEQHPTLNRTGIHRLIEAVSGLQHSISDQIVVQCKPSTPSDRTPMVYREGLVEGGEE